MRLKRAGFQFGVKLSANHKRMDVLRELVNLAQVAVLPFAGEYEACAFELPDIFRINLEAMAMTLGYFLGAIRFAYNGPLFKDAWICPEPHRATIIFPRKFLALLRKDVDYRMWCLRINLGSVRVFQTRDMPRVFDDEHVQAVAQAEIRNLFFTRKLCGHNLTLDACFSESAGDDDPVVFGKLFYSKCPLLNIFCIYPADIGFDSRGVCGEFYRLDYREVRIGEYEITRIKVFADDTDFYASPSIMCLFRKCLPFRKVGWVFGALADSLKNDVREFVALKIKRHVID